MKKTMMLSCVLALQGVFAIEVGSQAPGFNLDGVDGKTHQAAKYSLDQYKGKYVVLEWFNNDCPYVDKHYKTNNMQGLQKDFMAKDVVWFAVVSSAPGKQGHLTAESAKQVLQDRKASPVAVLFDESGSVGKSYGAKTTPHMYIINPQGKLIYQGGMDDDNSAKPESVATASPLFKNALTQALEGKAITQATPDPYGCSVKYASDKKVTKDGKKPKA